MDLKNIVFGEVTGDTFHHLRSLEKLGPKLTTLRVLKSELLPQEEHSGHGHH